MGKGDKKTKRGKIIIGSSGVSRSKKKKVNTPANAAKSESTAVAEEVAAKKAAKKAETAEVAEDKAKTAKAKKKTTEDAAE